MLGCIAVPLACLLALLAATVLLLRPPTAHAWPYFLQRAAGRCAGNGAGQGAQRVAGGRCGWLCWRQRQGELRAALSGGSSSDMLLPQGRLIRVQARARHLANLPPLPLLAPLQFADLFGYWEANRRMPTTDFTRWAPATQALIRRLCAAVAAAPDAPQGARTVAVCLLLRLQARAPTALA